MDTAIQGFPQIPPEGRCPRCPTVAPPANGMDRMRSGASRQRSCLF